MEQTRYPRKPQSNVPTKAVEFTLVNPEAQKVAICGSFNNWNPESAMPMTRREDGTWEASLNLAPGRHEYKFIADGQWIHDPQCKETANNSFGTLNSIIEVAA